MLIKGSQGPMAEQRTMISLTKEDPCLFYTIYISCNIDLCRLCAGQLGCVEGHPWQSWIQEITTHWLPYFLADGKLVNNVFLKADKSYITCFLLWLVFTSQQYLLYLSRVKRWRILLGSNDFHSLMYFPKAQSLKGMRFWANNCLRLWTA